jgi:adenylosuccinate lyase
MRYRVRLEVEYFIALCQLPLPQLAAVNPSVYAALRNIYTNFNHDNALKIKDIERTTNHDVKAVEYFLKEKFVELGMGAHCEFIHFGLTSQDVTTSAVMLGARDALNNLLLPSLNAVYQQLMAFTQEWKSIVMLAHTHGQPASPTLLGKEMRVFAERIENQRTMLLAVPFTTKFGGATGNFNAHHAAYPDIDWESFANSFIFNKIGLLRTPTTTQIEPYDNLAAFFDAIKRCNVILIDLCRDMWLYISMGYFSQKIAAGEVGSSAMPHKVNPIDFENAEGNLGVANALLEHFSSKLPISRLQRDLTDSTVLRNVGAALGHVLVAYKSVLKGVKKISVNECKIAHDLEQNWAVVAEGIQTILRREGYANPYEALKKLTRTNEIITCRHIHEFIDTLNVSDTIKAEMKKIEPQNYI